MGNFRAEPLGLEVYKDVSIQGTLGIDEEQIFIHKGVLYR